MYSCIVLLYLIFIMHIIISINKIHFWYWYISGVVELYKGIIKHRNKLGANMLLLYRGAKHDTIYYTDITIEEELS